MSADLLFPLAVFLLAYRRREGSATFGELIVPNAGPLGGLPAPGSPTYQSLTGLTEAEEWAALNRYRRPVGVASTGP